MHFQDITPARFDRFWSQVDTSAGVNGCWSWAGPHNHDGYARVCLGHTSHNGHRFAFISILGDPPPHLPYILHKCPGGSNRWCVNPAHLAPGTALENLADRAREGRARPQSGEMHFTHRRPELVARGERHSMAKLTDLQVRAIKTALAHGVAGTVLARQFHVDCATISRIKTGKAWAHVCVEETVC